MVAARVFSEEFRIRVAERMLNGESVSALSNELKIKRSVLYRWRDGLRERGPSGLSRRRGRPPAKPSTGSPSEVGSGPTAAERRVAELERRLGRLVLENDFLERASKRIEAARSNNNATGEVRCTEK